MKKLIALILVLTLALTLCACETSAEESTQATDTPAEGKEMVLGTLSLLNMTEEERLAKEKGKLIAVKYLMEQGAYQSKMEASSMPEPGRVIFYDTLDAMLMALEAGDINAAEVPVCVADYLFAHNDRLTTRGSFDLSSADDFTKQVAYRLGAGFSFLTTEDKTALRDELDAALTEMKEDGTLDALIQTYITDAVNGEPQPVEFTKTDGETIRVAVTGALPPMDYVAADGTPAGFNTAILAELGKRLNKNFELVVVDSAGRATALASGNVDLVFWTNGSDGRSKGGRQTKEEHTEYKNNMFSDSQRELMTSIGGGVGYGRMQNKDIPDGTITTQPYYNDLLIPVALK